MMYILKNSKHESGYTLVETLVAIAILGAIAVIFLGGLSTTSRAAYMFDEQDTAISLAQLQMEWIKKADYDDTGEYSLVPIPSNKDYIGYSVNATAESLNTPDDGIQRIAITVLRHEEKILTLETYKVDR